MAQHCLELLRRIGKRGARAKQLTMVEIARAQEAAFRPSVFETTLERLMERQMAAGGEWATWRVPRLMVFLKESVVKLGGHTTEGIFRISGDLGAVAELVCVLYVRSCAVWSVHSAQPLSFTRVV